jgi:hypothetical protein
MKAFGGRRGVAVTLGLAFKQSTFCPQNPFTCFVYFSEQRTIISLYSIKILVFITDKECA